jgi:hypothetical protein
VFGFTPVVRKKRKYTKRKKKWYSIVY